MKYQKIYNSIDTYGIEPKILTKLTKSTRWVVTEKIHGANFSVHYDGKQVKFAKRSGFIEDEPFYNYQILKKLLEISIKKLYDSIECRYVIAYGELCGGYYPEEPSKWTGPLGFRIDKNYKLLVPSSEKAIQEGIYYNNGITFITYDVAYKAKDQTSLTFLDYNECQTKLSNAGFIIQEALRICSYSEAVNYDIRQNSKLPKSLGMVELSPMTNIMEGIVLKPINAVRVKGLVRPLIKIKNNEFMEIDSGVSRQVIKSLVNYKSIMASMVNNNRVQSAISKIGEYNSNNKKIIKQEIYDDVMKDLYIYLPQLKIENKEGASKYLITLIDAQIKNGS